MNDEFYMRRALQLARFAQGKGEVPVGAVLVSDRGIIGDDCILENTNPAPDGSRHVGGAACLEWWPALAANQDMNFETEETWASGDRAIRRWRLRWGPGETDTVRGVNIMRVRDGKIVEAFGDVKG